MVNPEFSMIEQGICKNCKNFSNNLCSVLNKKVEYGDYCASFDMDFDKLKQLEPSQVPPDYIFDKNELFKKRDFIMDKFDEDIFFYGVLLPKWVEVYDKDGNIVGKKQIWNPVLI